MSALDAIYIYDAPEAIGLNIGVVAQYVAELLPEARVETRTDFFTYQLGRFEPQQVELLTEQIAARLAEREVRNLVHPDLRGETEPVPPEERDLGVVYRAGPLQDVMRPVILEEERTGRHLHLVCLAQCIGRFVEGLPLLKLKIMQYGLPTIISTTGFVEVPELPREYTFRRAQMVTLGVDDALDDLDRRFADKTLHHGDARITKVAVGYALQAVFMHLFSEGGCDERTCPLHRVRTHDELYEAHLSEQSGLCDKHARMLIEWREAGGGGDAGT